MVWQARTPDEVAAGLHQGRDKGANQPKRRMLPPQFGDCSSLLKDCLFGGCRRAQAGRSPPPNASPRIRSGSGRNTKSASATVRCSTRWSCPGSSRPAPSCQTGRCRDDQCRPVEFVLHCQILAAILTGAGLSRHAKLPWNSSPEPPDLCGKTAMRHRQESPLVRSCGTFPQ